MLGEGIEVMARFGHIGYIDPHLIHRVLGG